MSKATNVIFTGHWTCFVDTKKTETTDDDSHEGHTNGKAFNAKGICAIMNFTAEKDETRTLVHKIGHWYGAIDHYGTSGYQGTLELKKQTGLAFSEQCIYGENRHDITIQMNLTICDGCMTYIKQNATRFSHEE